MTTIEKLIKRYNNQSNIDFNDWNLDDFGGRRFHISCLQCNKSRGYQYIKHRDRLCQECTKLNQIKARSVYDNIDYSDFQLMLSGHRHYRVSCHECGVDRGYQEAKHVNKKCLSCACFKKDNPSVDRKDYVVKDGARKYKTYCFKCKADKGYLRLQNKEYNCNKCAMDIMSKNMTKLTPKQKKIRHTMSSSVWCRLNRRHVSKNNNSTFTKLPYSLIDLMNHLESLFEPWMNWDNHGNYDIDRDTWHIDHVVADSLFVYNSMDDIGFQESWALSNLQPLKALDNLIKGNRSV